MYIMRRFVFFLMSSRLKQGRIQDFCTEGGRVARVDQPRALPIAVILRKSFFNQNLRGRAPGVPPPLDPSLPEEEDVKPFFKMHLSAIL